MNTETIKPEPASNISSVNLVELASTVSLVTGVMRLFRTCQCSLVPAGAIRRRRVIFDDG